MYLLFFYKECVGVFLLYLSITSLLLSLSLNSFVPNRSMMNLSPLSASLALIFFIIHCFLFPSMNFHYLHAEEAAHFNNETDRLALLSFKNHITHDPYNFFASWNHTTHFCDWERIWCNQQQRVTGLRLFDMGLVGTITPQIANLTFLRELVLHHNNFHGEIPKEIGHLFRLQTLSLWDNSISGEIPTTLTQYSELKELDLGYNKLTGKLPAKLGSLTKLDSIGLYYNNLEGSIPPSLGNLSSLVILKLHQNNLEGSIPQGLCGLHNLHYLKVDSNRLTGSLPSCMANLNSLQIFSLSFNNFNGKIPPSIFNNQTHMLVTILSNNQFDGSLSFSIFANLSQLLLIDLSNNTELVVDTEYPSWSPSFQLIELLMSNCKHNIRGNNKIPRFLSTQIHLKYIDISSAGLKGDIPPWLFHNLSMSFVNFRNNSLEGLFPHAFSRNTSETKFLDISYNHIRGILPTNFHMLFPNLKILNMSNNELHGDLPHSFSYLEILDLSYNDFSGDIPNQLVTNNTYLQYMDLSKNRLQGNMLPRHFNMPNLKVLYLHGNRFTGTISPSLSNSSYLKVLDISTNFLYGTIPSWLPRLSNLIAVLFKENQLRGNIPNQLCEIKNLHIIDLSQNRLSDKIPSCFTNITSLKNKTPSETHFYMSHSDDYFWDYELSVTGYVDFMTKGNPYSYQGIVLSLMTGIDISGNELSGNIPLELGDLKELRALNLSNNKLIGPIPESFLNLVQLESLDLSSNQLNGSIPSALCQLDTLSYLNVSHNNFSGRTPNYENHCTTFTASSYEGNPNLCGEPLEKNCSFPPTKVEEGVDESWITYIMVYACFVFSYILGLWSVFVVFYFKQSWRRKYFKAVDECIDYCIVLVLRFLHNRCKYWK